MASIELKNALIPNKNPELKAAIDLGMKVAHDIDAGKSYQDAVMERFFSFKCSNN